MRHLPGLALVTSGTSLMLTLVASGFQGIVSNLTAEALSGTSVRVSWEAPVEQDDLKGYRVSWWIHRANQTNKAGRNRLTMSSESASAVIDGLKPYTAYVIEVIVEYKTRHVKWHGSPLLQLATTKPDGLPAVKGVHIATTARTLSSSDVVISWTTTQAVTLGIEVKYRVSLCIGSNSSNQVCRIESVNAPLTRVTFEGVKSFAALVAEVQPLVKTENNVFEGAGVATTGFSWTPEISGLSELTVTDVTEDSALVSWSKIRDFDKINGAHYNVVLSVQTLQDVLGNDTVESTDSNVAVSGSVRQEKGAVVRNVTTVDSKIELDKLKPWKNYTVTVTPTVVGDGQLFVGNMQSKDFTTLVGAPGKPRNVTVEEIHDGHTLRWLPPESWNGPPGGYEVSFTCVNGEVKGNSTSVTLEADRTALRTPTLSPNVPCTVSISAYSLYEGEPLDGPRVRVRFTPLARREDAAFVHPTIN